MNFSLPSRWSRNPGAWSAIDLQGGVFGVNVQLPRQPGQKPVVLRHVSYAGQSADAPVLSQIARTLSSAKSNVVSLMGNRNYQVFMVDKPVVRPDEVESSLRLVLSPMLDYPTAEANLDWFDIPIRQTMGSRAPQVYAVVTKTELVNAQVALFAEAKINLKALDIRESAQRNISFLLETDQAATCLVFADTEGVRLTITFKGELYLVRFISETLLDVDEHEAAHLADAVDRLALEIQRSFEFIRRNYPAINIDALHVAPMSADIGLAEALQNRLLEQIRPLDLASIFELPSGSDLRKPQVQARYFHALGSALRIQTKE